MRLLSIALVIAMLASCGRHREDPSEGPPARRAFYYWRTTLALSAAEQRAVVDLHVERIYLRVFDVGVVDGAPQMLGPVSGTAPTGVEIVPVVYLRAEVFKHAQPAALAQLVWREVQARAAAVGFTPRELQLDCDWTDSTREPFFAFLRAIKIASGLPLSSTIRLHQIKYRERTGVPPVERGTLMFYNMGKFSADPDARMIFDAASAAKYLARIDDYPLPLDVALPIWSWTVHTRDEMVVGLMQSTDPAELPALDFLRADGPERFVATRDAYLHGELLREGDVLKIEVTGPAETQGAAAMLVPHLARAASGTRRTVTLFDLSERNLKRHGTDQLEAVFRAIR